MITTVLLLTISFLIPLRLIFFFRGPQFGGKLREEHRQAYRRSRQWDGKQFQNLKTTTMEVNFRTLPGLLREQFTDRDLRRPARPLPVIPFDAPAFNHDPSTPKFVWYGHSVLLLQVAGKTLLIDPMLGPDAAPIAPFKSARFSAHSLALIDQLPPIDAILITHDHYDHLDYHSIKKLRNKTDTWFVALGVGRHLEKWHIPPARIREFDWWESIKWESIDITFTPSRHFSGRGPTDRQQSLWGGWVFKTDRHAIFWSGDGGYGTHFKEIGEKLGPFDWGFMECGQYNPRWRQIHMYPEEAIQAARDAGVKVATPVHWAGFALALHSWTEPAERFREAGRQAGQTTCFPRIGELVMLGQQTGEPWWEDAYS